jgi:hypothetical protein
MPAKFSFETKRNLSIAFLKLNVWHIHKVIKFEKGNYGHYYIEFYKTHILITL